MTTRRPNGTRRSRVRAAAILAATGIAGLVAAASNCTSGSPNGSPSSDGGTLDGASDAQGEAQSDTSTSDVAAEACAYLSPDAASRDSTWVGWHHVPQLDACCAVSVPDDLPTVPPLVWDPCDDASTGCLTLRVLPRTPTPAVGSVVVTRNDAGAPALLKISQALGADESVSDTFVYDLTASAPVAAWQSDNLFSPCHVFDVVPYADTISLLVRTSDQSLRLANGAPGAVMTTPTFQLLPGFQQVYAVQETATSDTVFAFDIVPSSSVYRTTLDSGSVQTTLGKQTGEALLLSFVEGADVFAYSAHGTAGYAQLYTVAADGTPTLLRGAADHDVSALATDGTSLVWTETYAPTDGGAPTLEFWSAPYATDSTTLAATAHEIASVVGAGTPFQAVAFSGIYAVYDGAAGVFVARLGDGHVVAPPPPSGYTFWAPSYVSNQELWVGVSVLNGAQFVGFDRIPLGTW